MSNFKPGDKVHYDGGDPYVFFGGPVDGVVRTVEVNGNVGIDAIPTFAKEGDTETMFQLVRPARLTITQEAIF